MRFMMLLKADKTTEAGVLPTHGDLDAMGKYNEQLVKAGALLDAPEIELRQMFELEDFADVPPAVAEMEKSFTAGRAGQKT